MNPRYIRQRRLAAQNRVLLEHAVEILRQDPQHTAILLDIDGTLAPVGNPAEELRISESTRAILRRLQAQYHVVGFITGRTALNARQVVGLDDALYFGNHGSERLGGGETSPARISGLEPWERKMRKFITTIDRDELQDLGIHLEDKGTIIVLHYRGAEDETSARRYIKAVSRRAKRAGFRIYRARGGVEIRPAAAFDKGTAIAQILHDSPEIRRVIYAGDDTTDIYAFRHLRTLVQMHQLRTGVSVAVLSPEQPRGLRRNATVCVDGPEGVGRLLNQLAQ